MAISSKKIRTIELQLLRHGPSHNQLLSPLTDYFALCGDHPNTKLNFPLEHESLQVRLRALRYEDSDETRRAQLHETARIAADVLAEVPGLVSDLGRYADHMDASVHLSIATSAAELALFPFELANSPSGFPGSGGALCLQMQLPVCVTRRSRNVRCDNVNWNVKPRILLIASDAGGPIPLESHYALLRKLVNPWVQRMPVTENLLQSFFNEWIEVLQDASVQSIETKMTELSDSRRPFTHVHILAHGCELSGSKDRYGVALHNPTGGIDAVDGTRLGRLLCTRLCADEVARPNVVTLAVCDSGNQGNVITPGASIALELHEANIPLVVGSQFPLSVAGSIVMTETLYGELLRGCDPREALWETRRAVFARNSEKQIKSMQQGRHDWSSMIAFAAFPENIDRETQAFKWRMDRHRISMSLEEGDKLLELMDLTQETGNVALLLDHVERRIPDIKSAVVSINRQLDTHAEGDTEWIKRAGVCASANKRLAEFLYFCWKLSLKSRQPVSQNEQKTNEIRGLMRKSHYIYSKIVEYDCNQSWALVQKLFLQYFLTANKASLVPSTNSGLIRDWRYAHCLCDIVEQRTKDNALERVWYLTNKIELSLLLRLVDDAGLELNEKIQDDEKELYKEEDLWKCCDELDHFAMEKLTRFEVYSGRRQLFRYPKFALMLSENGYGNLPNNFRDLFEKLEDRLNQQRIEVAEMQSASHLHFTS